LNPHSGSQYSRKGKNIEQDALSEAVKAIDGFAYMMQLVGYYTWRSSDNSVIDLNDAKKGIEYAKKDLRSGFWKAHTETCPIMTGYSCLQCWKIPKKVF
jgi:hypothetical protein